MKKKHRTLALPVTLTLLAFGICNQLSAEELLFSLSASSAHRELGSGFASVGDLNSDGVIDVAISDRSAVVASQSTSGIVHLVSGADGSPIRDYEGVPAASQAFGSSLAALNANGDGIPDLAVGSPGQSDANGFGAGAIRIYSGSDGSLLKTIMGPSGSQLGVSLVNAGDQDGDGLDDLYSGAPVANGNKGAVFAISSKTGAILRTISTTVSVSSFGITLAPLGDIDGDGLPDVAIGAPGFRLSNGNPVGRVAIAKSTDGSTATEIFGTAIYNRLGESLAPAADANGDGLPDLLVGSYSGGTARLVSGKDLSTLVDLSIPTLPLYRPLVVGGSLDFNDDGTKDWLIGSTALQTVNSQAVGGIRVVSGTDRSTLFEFTASAAYTGLGQSFTVLPGLGMAAGEVNVLDALSNGKGLARVWKVGEAENVVVDSDGDGVIDEEDEVILSIMDPTIRFGDVDSRVENRINGRGTTLADRYSSLGTPSAKRGNHFLSRAVRLTSRLKKAKLISHKEARRLVVASVTATAKAKRDHSKGKKARY